MILHWKPCRNLIIYGVHIMFRIVDTYSVALPEYTWRYWFQFVCIKSIASVNTLIYHHHQHHQTKYTLIKSKQSLFMSTSAEAFFVSTGHFHCWCIVLFSVFVWRMPSSFHILTRIFRSRIALFRLRLIWFNLIWCDRFWYNLI